MESRLGDAHYRSIAETLRAVPWEADPVTDEITYVGPQIEALTGYRVDEWTADQWRRSVHREDRDEVVAEYERHLYRQAEQIGGLVHWSCRGGEAVHAKLTFSDQAASLFGLPQAELHLSTHEYVERIVHPGDRERLHRENAAMVAARVPEYKLDYRIMRPDGSVAYIAEICREEYGPDGTWLGSFGILQDVTAQRTYELALRESQARYRQAERIAKLVHWSVAFSPDGQWDNNAVTFSDSAVEILGISENERRMSNAEYVARLVHPDDRDLMQATSLKVIANREVQSSITYRIVRPDGCVRWVVEHNHNDYDEAGNRISAFGIIQDITEHRQRELELAAASLRADLASRAKTQFLATMSHELRTPLNAIIGFSEVMKAEMMGPLGSAQYKEYASDIHGSGTFLLSIINELLDLSRIDAGELKLDEGLIDVGKIVTSSVSLLRSKAAAKAIKLTYAPNPDLPLLRGDARRLKQALLNLLSNAIKFTPAGGSVAISVSWSAEGLTIAVADSGIGIATEDLDRVMKPFVQVENWLARRHEGAGLGLAITKGICELHGGQLALDSEIGKGTVARIVLPRERVVPRPSYSSFGASDEPDCFQARG
jgi:PAS domain S-box-containing protein